MAKTKSTNSSADKRPQIDKFKDTARELECDDDEQRFNERVSKLVKSGKKVADDGKDSKV